MLTFGEGSGYDVKRAVDQSIGHFWRPAKSQIYTELRRLAALGYASEREVEQTRRPDKRLYRITPEGEAALRDWLAGPDDGPQPNTLLLKLFFGRLLPVEALIAKLDAYRRQVERERAALDQIDQRFADQWSAILYFPHLTLRYGIVTEDAELAWLDESIARLRERLETEGDAHGNGHDHAEHGSGRANNGDTDHRSARAGQAVRIADGG